MMLAAGVTGFAAYDRSNESDLFNANIEALAENEEDGDVNCSNKCNKRDCGYAEIGGTVFPLWWCI